MINNKKSTGFIIKNCSNKNTADTHIYEAKNIYLKSYKSYIFNNSEIVYTLDWTPYKNDAYIFTDKSIVIKLQKNLQLANKKYSIKPKYKILIAKKLSAEENY